MYNNIKAIYLLQQRADIYSEVFETMVVGAMDAMKTTTDKNTENKLKELLYSMKPYTDKIQENIIEYQKIVSNE